MKHFFNLWKRYSYLVLFAFLIFSLFDFRLALAAVICMAAPVIVSVFKGRFWCGNLCPRGNFYDNIAVLFSRNKKVPKLLKSVFFRTFMVIFMMTMFAFGIRANWGDPYGIGMVFYRMIVITTVIGIILSVPYSHRTWCHFCPMGTLASLIGGIRKSKRVLKVSASCVSCKICEKKCPLAIVPYDYKGNVLSHPDCIQCGKCVNVCPKKAIGYQ